MGGVLLLVLSGCARVSGLGTATPLEPGQSEVVVDLGLQAGGDAVSRAAGLPMPSVAVGYRAGLAEGMDLGVRLFPLGMQTDLRLALLATDRGSVALAPGLSGLAVMSPSLGWTELGLHLPLATEAHLAGGLSLLAGVESRTVIRGSWMGMAGVDAGAGARVDEYLGGGLGLIYRRGRLRLGWQVSGAVSVLRPGPPAWSTGPELGLRPKGQAADLE